LRTGSKLTWPVNAAGLPNGWNPTPTTKPSKMTAVVRVILVSVTVAIV